MESIKHAAHYCKWLKIYKAFGKWCYLHLNLLVTQSVFVFSEHLFEQQIVGCSWTHRRPEGNHTFLTREHKESCSGRLKSWGHSCSKVSHLLLRHVSQDASFQAGKHKPSNGSPYHARSAFDVNNALIKSTSCVASDGTGLLMSLPRLLSLTSATFDGVFFWISLLSDIAGLCFRLVHAYLKPIFYDFTVVAKMFE